MPRIPTFEAGEGGLRPSEAGSAAFREAGAITQRNAARVGQMIAQEGQSIGGGIAALGGPLGKMQDEAQQHNDSMAEIDFQNQLTKAEIAAQGGVNSAGTPTTSGGEPIPDHPGRGSDTSLPADANVPSPGSYADAAATTINNHGGFLDNLIGKITGTGISQGARDRMALQAAQSNRRLQVHAAAVAGEVAFTHATHTTEQTVNSVYGSVSRGEMSIPDALDHIDGAYNAFQGTLTGDFAGKGAKAIEDSKQGARQQAIWTGIYSQIQAGHFDNARAILNDPRYDKDVGGIRDQFEKKIQDTVQQRIKEQNATDAAKEAQVSAQRSQLVDDIYRNSRLPPEQQDPNLSRTSLEISPLFKGSPDELEKARKTLDTLTNGTIDPDQSRKIADGVSRGITDGTVTTPAQIDNAYSQGRMTWQDRTRLQTELKDARDNPATRQFNGDVKEWLTRNEGSIDPGFAKGGVGGRTELGQQMVSRWEQEVKRRAQLMTKAGQDPHELLDPNSPNSMVTPQARAAYRVTDQMKATFDANQAATDKTLDAQRKSGQVPTGDLTVPKALESIPNLARNKATGQFYDPAKKQLYNADGTPAKVGLQAPAPLKFAPDQRSSLQGSPAQQAIDAAMQPMPDAHLDKNLFSSGRAQDMGIKGGVGQNLASIDVAGKTVTVNAQAAPHFKAFLDDLTSQGYKIDDIGGYSDRMKKGSFSSYSEHAFGNAIDINPGRNPFHSHRTDLPQNVAQIAAKYGLIWGGNWSGNSADPMHFEWSGKGGLTRYAGR